MNRLALLAAAAVAGVLADGLTEPMRLRVRERTEVLAHWPASLDGVRVTLFSDVHVGAPAMPVARVARIVEEVRRTNPDLVLMLGDHIADVRGGRTAHPAEVAEVLGPLAGIAPHAGVLGNHDWYHGGRRVRRALEAVGLCVLEEQAVSVRVRDQDVWLAGVGDVWERGADPARALADVPTGAPTILLSHNPDAVLDVPAWVALTVAGHTHGGQVRFRGKPVHQVSPVTGNALIRGRYDVAGPEGPRALHVTPGLGCSELPVRFGQLPELTVLTLRAR